MSGEEVVEDIYALQAKITLQQSTIRAMKKSDPPASPEDVMVEVNKLNEMRANLAALTTGTNTNIPSFNRRAFDEMILRKMYLVPAFEIHNGPAGLFDYGPPACALKNNVIQLWRKHFVTEDNILEIECTNLTPHNVLETSGHVERFTDFMVRDEITGECFRADKLLEDVIDAFLEANPNMPIQEVEEHRVIQRQADGYTAEELYNKLMKYNTKSPTNPENNITKPFPFNLMFTTTIGPEGNNIGYLRPETAQGMFMNFKRLLDYNQAKMPFATAQVGLGFRNEIAPRNGLIRVREFCLAEIEHFVNPNEKSHPKLKLVASKELVLFPADAQLTTGRTITMSIGEAVTKGLVDNETLGYFMARTQIFLERIGVDPSRMRFRQHLKTEMAHYATDCWDMEIQMSHGWIECVGHADRACYDLVQHATRTGIPLQATEMLEKPFLMEKEIVEPNKKLLGPRFRGDQKTVLGLLEGLADNEVVTLKTELETNGKATIGDKFEITPELVTFKSEKKIVHERKYTPSVIEPAFGIGRIIYAVLEHAFSQRDGDEARCCMSLKPCVAPIKVGLYRLQNNIVFDTYIAKLKELFLNNNITARYDSSSGSLGRRYCRADELGIPFGVTIDFQTPIDKTVTLRDRDSMSQIRLHIDEIIPLITKLVSETMSWDDALARYPNVTVEEEGECANKDDSKEKKSTTTVEFSYRGSFSRPADLLQKK